MIYYESVRRLSSFLPNVNNGSDFFGRRIGQEGLFRWDVSGVVEVILSVRIDRVLYTYYSMRTVLFRGPDIAIIHRWISVSNCPKFPSYFLSLSPGLSSSNHTNIQSYFL